MKEYCTKCGSKLIENKRPAEDFLMPKNPFWPSCKLFYKKYDEKTGLRQWMKIMECPKILFKGFTKHTVERLEIFTN